MAHLVDFVQQDDRIFDAAFAQSGDHFARHRADVRPPMPSDLGLIAHATERDPVQAHVASAYEIGQRVHCAGERTG